MYTVSDFVTDERSRGMKEEFRLFEIWTRGIGAPPVSGCW
jgi:hypothetical protein